MATTIIYYDDQCGICGKWITLLQKYVSLRYVIYIGLSQAPKEIQILSDSHKSWVVERGNNYFLGYAGFIECIKESRFFGWFGYIGNYFPLKQIGNIVYKYVSSRRKTCRIKAHQ